MCGWSSLPPHVMSPNSLPSHQDEPQHPAPHAAPLRRRPPLPVVYLRPGREGTGGSNLHLRWPAPELTDKGAAGGRSAPARGGPGSCRLAGAGSRPGEPLRPFTPPRPVPAAVAPRLAVCGGAGRLQRRPPCAPRPKRGQTPFAEPEVGALRRRPRSPRRWQRRAPAVSGPGD